MIDAANDNEARIPLLADIHALRRLMAAAANDLAPFAADAETDGTDEAQPDSDQKAN